MVHVPGPTIVTVLPKTVATAESELAYVTAKSELAVPDRVKGALLTDTVDKAAKVIVWSAWVTSAVVVETEAKV
jgi:hypothetical protein